MPKAIVMADNDNVATALDPINVGSSVETTSKTGDNPKTIIAKVDIPTGNKIALKDLYPGDAMIKYNVDCGKVYRHIPKGGFVHVHNVKSHRIQIPGNIITEIMHKMGYSANGAKK